MKYSKQVQALIDCGLDVGNYFDFYRLLRERAFDIYRSFEAKGDLNRIVENRYYTINRKIIYGVKVVFVNDCTEISSCIEISKEELANVNLDKCSRWIQV